MEKYKGDPCPVCGKSLVNDFDVCPVCGWSNDYGQLNDPDMTECDNVMSLNHARKAWKEGKKIY